MSRLALLSLVWHSNQWLVRGANENMGTGAKCSLYAWIQRPQLPPPTVSSPTYCSQEVQVSYRGKEPWMAPRPLPLSFQVRTQREVIVQITGRARTPKGRGCGWEPGPLCPQHLHLGTNGRGHSTPSQRTPRNSPFVLCGLLGLGKDLTHSQKGRPLVGRLSLRPGLRRPWHRLLGHIWLPEVPMKAPVSSPS